MTNENEWIEAQRQYKRNWNKAHKEKNREYQMRYWLKQAEQQVEFRNKASLYQQNEPLSWKELKQMVGKPVWIEDTESRQIQRWIVIRRFLPYNTNIIHNIMEATDGTHYMLTKINKTWKAYRQEVNHGTSN